MGVIRGIPVSVKTRSMFLYTGWLSYMVPMVTVSGVSAVIKGGPILNAVMSIFIARSAFRESPRN